MSAPLPSCAGCAAAQGRSCCEVQGEERLATLTSGDIARIQAVTGLAASRFVDQEIFTPEAALAHEQLRPANAGAIRDGVRRHLLARGGACGFHRPEAGCTLPREAMPLQCRLYPLELDAFGRWRAEPSGACHVVDRSPDARALLRNLSTTEVELRALHAQLIAELGE